MATQAITDVGTRRTRHQSVSLVNSSLPATNSKADAQNRSQILSSDLARQRHLTKRKHPGHLQQGDSLKDNQKAGQAREVQQAAPGCHQQHTDDNSNSVKLCSSPNSKDDDTTTDYDRDTNNSGTRRSSQLSNRTTDKVQNTGSSNCRRADGNSRRQRNQQKHRFHFQRRSEMREMKLLKEARQSNHGQQCNTECNKPLQPDRKQQPNHQQQDKGSQRSQSRRRMDKSSRRFPTKMNKKQQQKGCCLNLGFKTQKDLTRNRQSKG